MSDAAADIADITPRCVSVVWRVAGCRASYADELDEVRPACQLHTLTSEQPVNHTLTSDQPVNHTHSRQTSLSITHTHVRPACQSHTHIRPACQSHTHYSPAIIVTVFCSSLVLLLVWTDQNSLQVLHRRCNIVNLFVSIKIYGIKSSAVADRPHDASCHSMFRQVTRRH